MHLPMPSKNYNEDTLIEAITSALKSHGDDIEVGIGDDAAVISTQQDKSLALSTDSMICNTHFLTHDEPKAIAQQLLISNMTDIYAMGAVPKYYLLNINAEKLPIAWFDAFIDELKVIQKKYNIYLIGGNCSKSTALSFHISIVGQVKYKNVKRGGGGPGDYLYLLGTLGTPIHYRKTFDRLPIDAENNWPDPRIVPTILEHATSAIDISDGLAYDLPKLLSSHGAMVRLENINVAPSLLNDKTISDENKYRYAVTGGEDYAICFTSPERITDKHINLIGRVEGSEVKYQLHGKDIILDARDNGYEGYEHFP